ncbi:hypothetical protein [Photobacterium sp. 1_MG-2023]|uniref:hypothetical protein n=1 Tax=Photobacterium sp. 1_MG-2023 TaxID=3062646 RepID=UPI0026E222E2|nr:hypothetical protein [Photobacterium sp. 1_MG-2023]MDO6708324.1 hypothetical protein [Photobacterium sp. 1_MG-2023]
MTKSEVYKTPNMGLFVIQGLIISNIAGICLLMNSVLFFELALGINNDMPPALAATFGTGIILTTFIIERNRKALKTTSLKGLFLPTLLMCASVIHMEYFILSQFHELRKIIKHYVMVQYISIIVVFVIQYFHYQKTIQNKCYK